MKQFEKIGLFAYLLFLLLGCENGIAKFNSENRSDSDSIVSITLLYTNDEHGWLAPNEEYGGAPGLMYKWKEREGFDTSGNFLVLSGGDMWSGPSISTWFQGEPMVEVMNAMDYDAAAIGNHEFDFKVNVLEQRLSEQSFPLLAANIVEKASNEIPDFAEPYIIEEIDGVKIGIIGLASLTTPSSTFPANVEDYSFTDYEDAINTYAREAKEDGATVLILLGHICYDEMKDLVDVAKENGISIIGGGHCHQKYIEMMDGVVLMQTGSGMRAYGKVEFDYHLYDSAAMNIEYEIVENTPNGVDAQILDIVEFWQEETDKELSEQIGYTDVTIEQASPEMRNMVCDSWLYTFPEADVALTNGGGIRQDIKEGPISLSTIVGLLPFENTIVKLEVTGEQLKVLSLADDIYMGGMTTIPGFFFSDGTEIRDEEVYTLLTNNYLYSRDDYPFSSYDPAPVDTYVHYREPLIEWLKSINTSPADPLSNYLEGERRR